MMRVLFSIGLFSLVALFETSFLTSLPFPLSLTPFVFGVGVYLLQHQGLLDGFFWMVGYGFFLQFLHVSPLSYAFLIFPIAATISYLSARHLFSNRSLYGVLACGLMGFVCVLFLELLTRFLESQFMDAFVSWNELFLLAAVRTVLLIAVIGCLFFFARPIRFLFHTRM